MAPAPIERSTGRAADPVRHRPACLPARLQRRHRAHGVGFARNVAGAGIGLSSRPLRALRHAAAMREPDAAVAPLKAPGRPFAAPAGDARAFAGVPG